MKIALPIVDVRDVAFAHVAAIDPERLSSTNAKRYIINEGSYWMADIVATLKEEFSRFGYKLPSSTLENSCLISFLSLFSADLKPLKPLVGRMLSLDNTKSIKELGVQYKFHRKTLLDGAYDLIQ